jgi:hypothetical protein
MTSKLLGLIVDMIDEVIGPLANALELKRVLPGRTAFLDGVGGKVQRTSPGKALFLVCSGETRRHIVGHLKHGEMLGGTPYTAS